MLPAQKRNLEIMLVLLPLLGFILIAVSFAPSAYGQAYPVERARFIGRFLLTTTLMLEGALLGTWFAHFEQFLQVRPYAFLTAAFLLLLFGLYPIRADFNIAEDIGRYKSWAAAWDKRQTGIDSSIESGEKDLIVKFLINRYGVKDIDGSTNHWMNKCMSVYYGINSIRSVPMDQ